MKMKLALLALAISTTFLPNANAWANGGIPGNSDTPDIGQFEFGSPGAPAGENTDGGDAADVNDKSISHSGNLTGTSGTNGSPPTSTNGGGGTAGHGGGSIFGAISNGGAAGNTQLTANGQPDLSSSGGRGGNTSGNSVSILQAVLTGTTAGNGGDGGTSGASGMGGIGGASVIGHMSIGGAGGAAQSNPQLLITSSNAKGGDGGIVRDGQIKLTDVRATGERGGNGGKTGVGGTGLGGDGGASVVGGSSIGGAGGISVAARPPQALTGSTSGGSGGSVLNNTVYLSKTNLVGADGGDGGKNDDESASGAGGHGGGSVIGGISRGAAAGSLDWRFDNTSTPFLYTASSDGGSGGNVEGNSIEVVEQSQLIGGNGGNGGEAEGASGDGGHGGGSIFGGLSSGAGAGKVMAAGQGSSSGGSGGHIANNRILFRDSFLTGGYGGNSGAAVDQSTSGSGGHGGGSIFGGLSSGGAASTASINALSTGQTSSAIARGGRGGNVTNNQILIFDAVIDGARGGNSERSENASGDGGHGGGSVFAGISQGAAGGRADLMLSLTANNEPLLADSSGGDGGNVSGNYIEINQASFTGKQGGNAEGADYGGGRGGLGGGSIFGGISTGGAGGYTSINSQAAGTSTPSGQADGGKGGNASNNTIKLTNLTLIGANGGQGGTSSYGGNGANGLNGGSIFGGYSAGGAAGSAGLDLMVSSPNTVASTSADGGAGGETSNNRISLAGISSITGDIYGGYSQGGSAGTTYIYNPSAPPTSTSNGSTGLGGLAQNNHITLIGTDLNIGGSIYGGYSVDGDGTAQSSRAFTGNTLQLDGYRGTVEGVYNFENYNWTLPADVVNRDVLIGIRGTAQVDLSNTKHNVAMLSNGNQLNSNDEVVLISKAQGTYQPTQTNVQQGYFLVYDALLEINNSDEFVLRILNQNSGLNPTSKVFLQGRAAALAFLNHGADMISEQLASCSNGLFIIGDGGSSRYNTGSHVKVSDQRLAIGGRKCFDLPDSSQLMIGAFAEHGTGNYHSSDQFADVGKINGHGDLRYTGAGLVAHMDVADTGAGVSPSSALAAKDGLYLDGAVRAGHIRSNFTSNQLVDAAGQRASYSSKSHYASAMFGVGYAWNLAEQQQIDIYARYTWDRLAADNVKVGGDELRLATAHSSRLRVGTRYNFSTAETLTPYLGIAYEHEFDGKVKGKVFDRDLDQPKLQGSSGVVELGISTAPLANSAFKIDLGVQGYFGRRKGSAGSLSFNYEF